MQCVRRDVDRMKNSTIKRQRRVTINQLAINPVPSVSRNMRRNQNRK